MERDSRNGSAVEEVAAQEFGGEVLGIGGTTAVAEEEGLVACAIRLQQGIGGGSHRGEAGRDEAVVDLDAAFDIAA